MSDRHSRSARTPAWGAGLSVEEGDIARSADQSEIDGEPLPDDDTFSLIGVGVCGDSSSSIKRMSPPAYYHAPVKPTTLEIGIEHTRFRKEIALVSVDSRRRSYE